MAATESIGTLYQWPDSAYCLKVRLAAIHKGLPLDLRWCRMQEMSVLQRETGFGKVPCLRTKEGWLTDSTAILAWMDRSYPEVPLYPANPRDRADSDLLEDWADEAINVVLESGMWIQDGDRKADIMFSDPAAQRWFRPFMMPIVRRKMRARVMRNGGLRETFDLFARQMDMLEARLGDRPWIFGEEPYAADFAIAGQLINAWRFRYPGVVERPRVTRMVERAAAMLGLHPLP